MGRERRDALLITEPSACSWSLSNSTGSWAEEKRGEGGREKRGEEREGEERSKGEVVRSDKGRGLAGSGGGVEKNRLAGHVVARDESLQRQNETQPLRPKKLKRKQWFLSRIPSMKSN